MTESEMLPMMCQEALSDADVRAICKQRGFSAEEASSRALFENFFLSETGVGEVLRSLLDEEIALLHLLRHIDAPVDLECLAPIYGGPRGNRYDTFARRYTDVFREVKKSLVQAGVLLMAEMPEGWDRTSKVERWRFRFPDAFGRHLPPLVKSRHRSEETGDIRAAVVRDKLKEITGAEPPVAGKAQKKFRLQLVDGEIRGGEGRFSARLIREWQQACWQAAAGTGLRKLSLTRFSEKSISAVEAATYALGQLDEHEWVLPQELRLALSVFLEKDVEPAAVCEAGWQWGCLARLNFEGRVYYRLTDEEPHAGVEPGDCLEASSDGAVAVSLDLVPLPWLGLLNEVADLSLDEKDRARLRAAPNRVKIGRVGVTLQEQAPIQWLKENAGAFAEAFDSMSARAGKQIVHENLLVARVTDLSLKVDIERAFSGQVVSLTEESIAFPQGLLAPIEKLVTKAGHVVRTVERR